MKTLTDVPSGHGSFSAVSPLRANLPLIIALALAAGAEAFTSSAIGLALPRMGAEFAASPDEISWAITLYLAGYGVGLPLTAWFADRLGQRRHLGLAMSVYALASVGCMMSPSLPVFLVIRIVQGAAGAAFVARALFTITKQLRPPYLIHALFIFIGGFSLRALGLPLGGYLVDHLSWRWLFVVPVVVLAGGALPSLWLSREIWPRRAQGSWDLIAFLSLMIGVGSLLVLLYRGQRDDWFGSPRIIALAVVAAVALPTFVWRERRVAIHHRLIPFESLRYRGMIVGAVLSFLAGVMMVGGVYVLPQFLLRIVGCDATEAGWLLSIDAFALMAGLAIAAWTLGRVLTRSLLTVSGGLFAASMLLLAGRITSATSVESLYLPMILHGIAVGLALPPIGIFSFRTIGANHALNGEGRAWHYTARTMGTAVATAGVVMLLDVRTASHSGQLAEYITAVSVPVQQTVAAIGRGLVSHGYPPYSGESGALTVLGRIVTRESTVLSFRDLFFLTAFVGLVVSALSFSLPKLRASRRAVPTSTPSTLKTS